MWDLFPQPPPFHFPGEINHVAAPGGAKSLYLNFGEAPVQFRYILFAPPAGGLWVNTGERVPGLYLVCRYLYHVDNP